MAARGNYLNRVLLSADVYALCLQHALSTEAEEVMGLLIGEVDEKTKTSHISFSVILERSDKQEDRVEISPDLLMKAANRAEQLAQLTQKQMRVVGWYHSHPHITVEPSAVDLRTQAMYQNMDDFFVGIIISVFDEKMGSKKHCMNLISFQAIPKGSSSLDVRHIRTLVTNAHLSKINLDVMIDIPNIFGREQENVEAKTDEGDDLVHMHNEALRKLSLVIIAKKVSRPMCEALELRAMALAARIQALSAERDQLRQKLNL